MPSDEFISHKNGPCAHLSEIGWERYYGTTSSGNLPQHNATSNPCGVDVSSLNQGLVSDLDIRARDFRYHHVKCFYSAEATLHEVVDLNPLSATYGQSQTVSTAAHTVTGGIMIRFNRGSKYGWLCVDDNCPYYTDNGRRYFYY